MTSSPNPDFYLTTEGEFPELAGPRACWVTASVRSTFDSSLHLVTRIEPPVKLREGTSGLAPVSQLLLSPGHKGESLLQIKTWPCSVYVLLISDESIMQTQSFLPSQVHYLSKGLLYAEFPHHVVARLPWFVTDYYGGPQHSLELVQPPGLYVVAEQSGPIEDRVKSELTEICRRQREVKRAYLVTVRYPHESEDHVALCIIGPKAALPTLVEDTQKVIRQMFNKSQHLDILFLSAADEWNIAQRCRPFFSANP